MVGFIKVFVFLGYAGLFLRQKYRFASNTYVFHAAFTMQTSLKSILSVYSSVKTSESYKKSLLFLHF